MGKHVKKKTESSRPAPLRKESRVRDPYEDWFGAAGRELDFDDVFSDAEDLELPETEAVPGGEAESSPLPEIVEAQVVSAPMRKPEPVLTAEDELFPSMVDETPDLFSDPEPAKEAESILSPEEIVSVEEKEKAPAPAKERENAPLRPREAPRRSGEKRSEAGKRAPRPSGGKKPPARSGKKKRKNSRAFRKGLRIYIIVMLVIILAICAALWVFLTRWQGRKDAEAAQEAARHAEVQQKKEAEEAVRRAPQRTFEAWLAGTSPDYWTDLWYAKAPSDLDDRDAVRAWMQEHFTAAEPFRATEYTAEAPVYVLREGDDTLARVALSGGGTDWNVSQVELLVEGKESASVSAITGSRVFCNGRELGPEYISESTSPFTYAPLADRLVNPVERITYSVEGLLLPVELTAEPPAGQKLTQTSDGDFLPVLEGEAADAMAKRVVDFVRAYLFYYMKGSDNTQGNLYYALSFLTPGTQAYRDLNDTYLGVVWNTVYANVDTSKATASDVVIWADNCCSVDVTYDADCTLGGQHIDYLDGTMRIYFLKDDGGNYYISNFESL